MGTEMGIMEQEAFPAPEHGVYVNQPSEEYHQWKTGVLSKSLLWNMVTGFASDGSLELCPAKLEYERRNPRPTTDALTEGGALDCLLLEPHEFDQRYVMAGSCAAPAKKGSDKACGSPGKVMVDGEWRCGTHGRGGKPVPADQTLLDHIQMSKVRGWARSIRSHPIAGDYFAEAHEPQVAMVGTVFGRRFKGRFDLFRRGGGGMIVDLKTARDARPHVFGREMIRLGYHCQMFIYSVLAYQHGWMDESGQIELVVVGKSAIYGCGKDAAYPVEVYPVSDEMLALGSRHLEQLVEVFDRCEDMGKWPVSMDCTKRTLGVPRWMDESEEDHGSHDTVE